MYIDSTCFPRRYVLFCPRGSRILFLGVLFFFAAGASETISGAQQAQQSREPGPQLRGHIHVYVDRERATLDTPLELRSRVDVIAAISGG